MTDMTNLKHEKPKHPPLDFELKKPLEEIIKKIPYPLTLDLIHVSRYLSEKGKISDHDITRDGTFTFQEYSIFEDKDGSQISMLICLPTQGKPPYPTIYNIHGGGMVAGNNRTLELAGELNRAEQCGFAVAAVNYRLAPEYPDPTPVEDCYLALQWLIENATSLQVDKEKIIISGNSAGGGLAAGVTLLARERKGPKLIGQMLQCPMLDDRCNTKSADQMKGIGLWDTLSNLTGWTALLGKRRGTESVSCFAAPARAESLKDLPPTFVDVGAVESLRDEAINYVSRILSEGGDAELHVWGGAFHSFDQWVPEAILSKSAHANRVDWMKRLMNIMR